jgi:hypothetical protein
LAEVILRLVDRDAFRRLSAMSVEQLVWGFESGDLRTSRPAGDSRFHRGFDVDIEGDFLEWADSAKDSELDSESLLILANWSSVAEWRCWDGRLFLYIEPTIQNSVENVDEFLSTSLWDSFSTALNSIDGESFSESVVLDWMNRRQELGETLNPDEDPRILPTMESHKSLTSSLYDFIELSRDNQMMLMIGREYLEPESWNLEGITLEGVV